MNRKSQIFAVREIFQFAIGVVLLISIISLFNTTVTPIVENYALEKEVNNINSHIYYIIQSIIDSGNELITGDISTVFEMPNSLGDYAYRVYFNNSKICTLIEDKGITDCFETNNSVTMTGVFLSGGDLQVDFNKDLSSTTLILSN